MRLTPRVAGYRSEYPAGFKLECMAGFVGTRTKGDNTTAKCVVCTQTMVERGSTESRVYKLIHRPEDA